MTYLNSYQRIMDFAMKHRLYQPLREALVISVFIPGLFYYWYGLADRYSVFLYGHIAAGIPPAQPFDRITSSRYWMCGLVASGAVMVLYGTVNWSRGRIAVWRKRRFVPSSWWQVWGLAAVPLSLGIPVITMTVNAPTLPLSLAAACVTATLLGLAVALLPGKWAAERPLDLMWLAVDSLGLMPVLLLLRAVELPGQGVSLSLAVAWLLAMGGMLAGGGWLAGMSLLRLRRRQQLPGAGALLLAGLGLSYVLLPLVHHLLATPPAYRYISTASNFFAFNPALQLLAMGVAAGLAVGVTRLRRRFAGTA
jgi:hypothetical protein